MIYVVTQGNEFSYKIYLQFNEYRIFWRELDLQLLFSNLVPRTFPRSWLSTTAHKRMKPFNPDISTQPIIPLFALPKGQRLKCQLCYLFAVEI